MFATLSLGVIFLKILFPFGRFGRGNSVRANFKVRWEFWDFLKFCGKRPHFLFYKIGKFYFALIFKQNVEERKD
ncbi:hypothetical protein JO83_08120 [Avibacterium paragallinarum]|nr:hypothetical protein JO83_08120 [Avibacterium paragallinarum]